MIESLSHPQTPAQCSSVKPQFSISDPNLWYGDREIKNPAMAFEIPYDLINQLQITLRKEANISSYDPDDPSLPDLPSIEQSVSELDPSPPHLRCKQCKAKLLRGTQSVACVFCGRSQRQELPPDPINFKSTCGYDWFLKHLDLNASDMVEPSLKATDSSQRKNTRNEEVPLSDILDLEIKWVAGSQNLMITNEEAPVLQAKSSLHLVGINLDNVKSDAKTGSPSSSNSNALHGEGNVSFVENVQPSETAGGSVEDTSSKSFSDGWQADFQPASSGNLHVELKSFDPFAGSGDDLSASMDAVFGPTKDVGEKPKDATVPSTSNTSDIFQDDPFNSSNFINVNDGAKVESADDSSDWFQDEKWQTRDNKDPMSKTVNEDDDSFDVWNDFTRSTTTQDPSAGFSLQNVDHLTPFEKGSETNLFSSTNVSQDIDFGSFSQSDFFSGPFSKQDGLTGDNNTEFKITSSDRMNEVEAKGGGKAEAIAESGDVSNATKSPEVDEVEMLMSQMHDLSFMLDGNLSIPPKRD